MRIGIFGGTFDPPHVGHLILAAEAVWQRSLDRLLWVLTAAPPHKRGQVISPVAVRLALVQAALKNDPVFELSRMDIDRPPPHYALDTVRLLRQRHPQDELVYLMGGDSLYDLPTWHRPLDFIAACDELGVMQRPGDQIDLPALEDRLPGLRARLHFINAPLLEISASEIRQRVAGGQPYRYYLPADVYALVQGMGLYTTPESTP